MHSLTVAHFRGIDVRVHPTFGLVLLWVLYHFGLVLDGGVGGVLYGLLLMVLVFVCVVLHELGHSFMAQEYGIRVRNITIFPFGGAAFIEQMPMSARGEVAITVAGPAVNAAICVALMPVIMIVGALGGLPTMSGSAEAFEAPSFGGMLIYLAVANLLIILFNLLPAFPMDGGRLVRAGLTVLVGRERATSIAVGLGAVVAVAMIILGALFGQLILPVLALFVIFAAYGEGKSVRLESSMRRLRVGQFALWDSGGISANHPINAALRGGPRDMVVTDEGRVVGMLWRRDVLRALNGGVSGRLVRDVMDYQFWEVDVDDSVYDVQQRMTQLNRWAVPVTEGGQYRGIFTSDRLVHVYRYLDDHSPERRVAGLAAGLGNSLRGGTR